MTSKKIFTLLMAGLSVLLGAPSLMAQQTQTQPKVEKPAAEKPVAGKKVEKKKKKATSERFVRVRKDDDGKPIAMETSTTTYTKKLSDGSTLQVDLIGVVHIGEKEYYTELNEQFKQYDALLYELVAPKGTRIDQRRNKDGGLNPVAALQKGMMSMLGLQFQLDHIDYGASNFVHADMSPEEFAESMEKNNESLSKMFFKMLGMSAAMSGQSSEAEMLSALFASGDERIYRLRRTASKQLIQMDVGMSIWEGDNGSTIITHRNGKAFEVLDQQIKSGKRKIGVFYGAGHLENMEERLLKDFDMKAGEQKWALAWKLRADAK